MKRFKDWKQPIFDHDGWAYKNGMMREEKRSYGWRCLNFKNLKIGKNTDIGHGCFLQAKYGIELGEKVELGPFVYICSWSTIDDKKGKVVIKDGAKVGAGVIILPNVIIGKNSVVGAGAVVLYETKIQDNELWLGIPAKKRIKK